MTTYTMEAKENYPADVAAAIDGGAFATATYTDHTMLGYSYDHVRRKLIWPGSIWPGFTEFSPNDSGYNRWNGRRTVEIGDNFDLQLEATLFVFEKDMDTGVVTAYDTFDPTEFVPNGIGGSDGTNVLRFISDIFSNDNFPTLIDPRTGNSWMHLQSCELLHLRRADDFKQIISPLFPVSNLTNGKVKPVGITADWVYAIEDLAGAAPGDPDALYVTPRLITAAEITADELLIYKDYDLPVASQNQAYRTCVMPDAALWLFNCETTDGANLYTLWKFTPPTLGAYPATGGGWTDETPWAAGTGPNANNAGYDLEWSTDRWARNLAMPLPDQDAVVLVSQHYPADGTSLTDADYRMDVTYADTDAATFTTYQGVLTGYMDATLAEVASLDDAAWVVDAARSTFELNSYLDCNDYDFGVDYRDRWIGLAAFPVVEGIKAANSIMVLIKFRFDRGAAPQLLTIIPETGWDDAYPAYAATLTLPGVVVESIADDTFPFNLGRDTGVYDAETNAFWWSGASKKEDIEHSAFWAFDAAFTPRQAYVDLADIQGATAPLMRLTFTEPVPRRVSVSSYVGGPT